MNKAYSILMQKEGEGNPVQDLEDDFQSVCTTIPYQRIGQAKKPHVRDWKDEDGEDVYFPTRLMTSAYSIDIGMATKGENVTEVNSNIDRLIRYLTGADGTGCSLKVYAKHIDTGRQKVYYEDMTEPLMSIDSAGFTVLEYTITLRISDPITKITLA